MSCMYLFLSIIFFFIFPFNAIPKFYLMDVNNEYKLNLMDTSNGKSVTETVKTLNNNYKSNKRRSAKLNGDHSPDNEKNKTNSSIAPDAISNETKAFLDKINKKSSGYKLMEGDMILNPNQQKSFGLNSSNKDYEDMNQGRAGYQWPNSKMYYIFDDTVEENFRSDIISAITELAKTLNGCVEIEEGASDNNVIVSAEKTGQCQSMVGVNREMKNTLNLDPLRCREKETIQHEFMHSLGIYHQQARKDRDQYVNIKWQNIKSVPKNMTHNFQKKEDSESYDLPYDYDSLMHYGPDFFSKNGAPTIETKNPANQERIGKQVGISPGDVKLIKAYYGCQEGDDLCKEENVVYLGQDLVATGKISPNELECHRYCKEISECGIWVYHKEKKICLLKANKEIKKKENNNAYTSGRKDCLQECKSTEGNSCMFPFKYKGVEYNRCTDVSSENGAAWCATEVDNNGEVIIDTWEDCSEGCPRTGTT